MLDEIYMERTALESAVDRLRAELAKVTKERDAAVQRAERAEAKLCTRCKQSCKHLCSTPQADADIEADERAAAVWWLRRELADRVGKHTAYMRGMRSAFRVAAAVMQAGEHRADWDEHHADGAGRGEGAP